MDLLSFLHLVGACITLHWILSSTLYSKNNSNIQKSITNEQPRNVHESPPTTGLERWRHKNHDFPHQSLATIHCMPHKVVRDSANHAPHADQNCSLFFLALELQQKNNNNKTIHVWIFLFFKGCFVLLIETVENICTQVQQWHFQHCNSLHLFTNHTWKRGARIRNRRTFRANGPGGQRHFTIDASDKLGLSFMFHVKQRQNNPARFSVEEGLCTILLVPLQVSSHLLNQEIHILAVNDTGSGSDSWSSKWFGRFLLVMQCAPCYWTTTSIATKEIGFLNTIPNHSPNFT